MKKLIRITAVKPLEDYRVSLDFTDGTEGTVDLKPYLWGPVFEPIRKSRKKFLAVRVEHGTLVWSSGADLCPDVLYQASRPIARARRSRQRA